MGRLYSYVIWAVGPVENIVSWKKDMPPKSVPDQNLKLKPKFHDFSGRFEFEGLPTEFDFR